MSLFSNITVKRIPMVPSFHDGHALLIGAGGDLPCTISDVKGLADILKNPGRCAYPPDQVKLLTAENASKSRILESLDELSQRANNKSIVVIYFSGHGYRVESTAGNDSYYLMPFGYDVEQLGDTAISGYEFAEKIKAIKAENLLLLLDCCHAGGLADTKLAGMLFTKSPLLEDEKEPYVRKKGQVFIASSMASELSIGGDPYSAFTLALIEAFCGVGASVKDGFVRVADMALHAREKVPAMTGGEQHPILHFDEARNFRVAYYSGGDPELKGLPFNQVPEIYIPQQPLIFIPHLPPPPRDFTGRDNEQESILKAFARGDTIIGLFGMAGIGKTALAYALAEKLAYRYPDGQILVEMRGTNQAPVTSADAMARVIRAYYPKFKTPESEDDQDDLKVFYHSLLYGKRALLVLDNAADDQQVLPLLPPKNCAVLITSRCKFTLPGMHKPFSLGVMKQAEARKLLRRICPRIRGQARELARLCGRLPLALRAAASLLAVRSDIILSEYLKELRSERTRLKKIGKQGVDLDVESSLNLSYGRLPEDMPRVFRQLSVFPADFDAAAEEVICLDESHRHLSELVRWNLVDFSPDGRYSLHELVRIFASSKLMELGGKKEPEKGNLQEKDKLYWRYYVYYLSMLSEANNLYSKCGDDIIEGARLFDREEMNILAVQERALKQASETSQKDLKCLALRLSCFYPHLGSSIFALRLDPQKYIKLLKYSLRAAHRLRNENIVCLDKWICSHLCDRGIVYENLGEMKKAIRLHKKQRAIAHKNHYKKEEGNALYQIGKNYADQGYVKKAINCHKKAVSVFKRAEDYQGIVKPLVAEGIIRRYIGEVSRAIRYHKRALNISQEKEYEWGIAYSLNNLGNDYVDQNKIEDALKCYRRALTIDRSKMYLIGVVADLGNIGYAYACKDYYRNATNHLEKAIKISQNIGDRKGEAKAEAIQGLVCEKKGYYDEAIKHHERALNIVEKIGYRRRVGQSYVNIANAYASKGDHNIAINHLAEAIKVAKEIGDQKGEAKAEAMLGKVHFKCHKCTNAIECHEKALKIVLDMKYRRREGHALNNLGNDYAAKGEHTKAMDYYNQARNIYKEIGDHRGKYNVEYNIKLCHQSPKVGSWFDNLKW